MKKALLLALAASLASAQPHHAHHRHHHVVKRNPNPVADEPAGPMQTIVVYELNGHTISEAEVEQGIRNGSLIWAGEAPAPAASSYKISSAAPAPSSSKVEAPSSAPAPTQTSEPAKSSVASAASTAAPSSQANQVSTSSTDSNQGTGVDSSFPDGKLDCSTFPSQYGAVPVNWLGLGGWTGVQSPGTHDGSGYNNILTVTHAQCSGSGCCTEGSFCSYACPAGYQKSQWPTTQGSTGQSVGGIQCKNGKLYLTNPDMSGNLCMKGTSKVNVQIVNKLGKNAAVCRTDYPGTESETIPLDTQPGSSHSLTCPEATNYYQWLGKPTSAQYYVNNAGVSVSEACQWGDGSSAVGNFAPLNLGVGYSNGQAWLSIFQNSPTTYEKLGFTIEITGDNVVGKCKYSNGQYCAGDNCNAQGCTVSAASGNVYYNFY